jgi:hypothetical protein
MVVEYFNPRSFDLRSDVPAGVLVGVRIEASAGGKQEGGTANPAEDVAELVLAVSAEE